MNRLSFLGMLLSCAVASLHAQQADNVSALFEPMAGRTWVGHYVGSPEDEHLVHVIRWDIVLDGAVVRKVKEVAALDFCEITLYFWDWSEHRAAFAGLTNRGHGSRGTVTQDGGKVVSQGRSWIDADTSSFALTFEVDATGSLQDEFFQIEGTTWRQGHHVVYTPDAARQQVACGQVWAATAQPDGLLAAAREGDLAAVWRSLALDPEQMSAKSANGSLPLHLAGLQDNREVLEALLAVGAEIDARNDYGYTALHWAVMAGHENNVALLLDRGADVNASMVWGSTPLHLAASRNRLAEASLLLAAGAEPNARGNAGVTPLHDAVSAGDAEMVEFLLERGADANAQDEWGARPLHIAAYEDNADMIASLLRAGADVGAVDASGTSALHRATVAGDVSATRTLIASGADVNVRDRSGRTPLTLAARYGHGTLVSILAEAGAGGDGVEQVAAFYPFETSSLENGEAIVWYLGHSGWAVKTRHHLLIFDYQQGPVAPAEPKLANGFIHPEELRDQSVVVFVSHEHTDHFDRTILDWRRDLDDITYVFGWRAFDDPEHVYTGPRGKRAVGNVAIESVHSPEAGAIEGNFLVRVDGVTLYHSGDYSRPHDTFRSDMQYLAKVADGIDLFFMLAGNAMDDNEALIALEIVRPRLVLPMHQGGRERRLEAFAQWARDHGVATAIVAPENRGDRFEYRDGRITEVSP